MSLEPKNVLEESVTRHDMTRSQRVQVRFSVRYADEEIDGSGSVCNISHSGALIEPAYPTLKPGTKAAIEFSFFDDTLALEVATEVTRETGEGFAVRFSEEDSDVRHALGLAVTLALALENLGKD